jgi:hypothetical protein
MKDTPYIPVSVGELFDKYTILKIKQSKINNPIKLAFIEKELLYFEPMIQERPLDPTVYKLLMDVNLTLWRIEDEIREKENKKEFDSEFVELARMVYISNDQRNIVKQMIDKQFSSELCDVKSYVEYT